MIAGNRVRGGGEGIAIEKGRGNVVARNVVVGIRHQASASGSGTPRSGAPTPSFAAIWSQRPASDGFLVAKNDRNALLRGNIARRSGDDGFDINSRSARLVDNRAVGSADTGIEHF